MSNSPTKKRKHKPDLKVVLLGDNSVGKTCLIHRYLDRKFTEAASTIGASFLLKQWSGYNIAIWDTAGEERYRGLTSFYVRGAGAAILAFDPQDESSFEALTTRFNPLLDDAAEDQCLKVVVGTKLDMLLPNTRKVTREQGCALAKRLNPSFATVPYFETSSVSGMNVDETFDFIFKQYFSRRASEQSITGKHKTFKEETVKLDSPLKSSDEKSTKCCKA